VSVLSSPDCEELLRHKGINGGLLELLRPFGERIAGRVVIRDSTGASRPWDDFGIRFTGVRDGLEAPRLVEHEKKEQETEDKQVAELSEYKPARLRSGGDALQIDEVVERHLEYAEHQASSKETDYLNVKDKRDTPDTSPFYALYLRRLLSGTILSPHETFSHPVTQVIAISSRNPAPIEELRNLYASSNTGDHRLPQFVNNEFLRYYVLVHDEDYDDIKKSTTLYEQMKRHFGLHCHLLRLRSTQCLPTDDESMRLPQCEWQSAAEELTEILTRETLDDDEDPTPYIFESDAAAVRSFVREMATQSIIPGMERMTATWNDQVAAKRRGISGRFISLSKRFTGFSGRSATGPTSSSNSNYNSTSQSYRPDTPEALMRKLADYALMLRDFKLAAATYESIAPDYKNDKAWRYYAGANEMAALTTLLSVGNMTAKYRVETVDQFLENAYYSYTTRCASPFYAHRGLALCVELLRSRAGSALDDASRWLGRIIEDRLVGPVGHALLTERVAGCYAARAGVGALNSGNRKRKAAFWSVLAASAWVELDKFQQAEKCLRLAGEMYGEEGVLFDGMKGFIEQLSTAVEQTRPAVAFHDRAEADVAEVQTEQVDQRTHRKSVSIATAGAGFDPLGVANVSGPRSPVLERPELTQDGFE